ncbi:MAG: YkgJ family cysteine cluster protein [Desulfosarcinaceae bacterium]|nr:YkgJ family cysteine cluster protein [Desulfosarcinaceae bacterium]
MQDQPLSYWAPQHYFFDQGLRFDCVQCGHCCTGDPGIVFVSAADLSRLAIHLQLSIDAVIQRYLSPWRDSYTIREAIDGRCLFYDQGCAIYRVRPTQCRTWPFWPNNLRSQSRWKQVAKRCPGIGQGRRYTREEILSLLSTP